jgi:hypothetical protein
MIRPYESPKMAGYAFSSNPPYWLQPCSAGGSSALGSPGAVAQASSTSVTIRRPAPSCWQTIRPCSSMQVRARRAD